MVRKASLLWRVKHCAFHACLFGICNLAVDCILGSPQSPPLPRIQITPDSHHTQRDHQATLLTSHFLAAPRPMRSFAMTPT